MIHLGDYRDTLTGRYGALITDPPYSAKVHKGHDEAVAMVGDDMRNALAYAHWSASDCNALAEWANEHVSGWWFIMCDHTLWWDHAEAAEAHGRYVFQPIPCFIRGMTVRMCGDGPSSWAVYACVSRPKTAEAAKWGTLPGYYLSKPERCAVTGGKPLRMMQAIVRDYSRPGDIVVDPCAGGGTTLLASKTMGRQYVGSEIDPGRHALADAAVSGWAQSDLLAS